MAKPSRSDTIARNVRVGAKHNFILAWVLMIWYGEFWATEGDHRRSYWQGLFESTIVRFDDQFWSL